MSRPLSTALVSLPMLLLFCTVVFFAPPRWGPSSGLASSIDKHHRLETAASPKIVLIGGSNVSVGVDSARIQAALRRDIVNMGLGASLGLRYMMEEVKDDIHPGDLIVVLPEYDYFCQTTKGETNAQFDGCYDLLHLWQVSPGVRKYIAASYMGAWFGCLNVIDDFQHLISNKGRLYVQVLRQEARFGFSKPLLDLCHPRDSIYLHRDNFNSFGDFVGHLNLPSPGFGNWRVVDFQEFRPNEEAFQALSDFGKRMSVKHVTVLLIPPPIPGHQVWQNRVDEIYQRLRSLDGVTTLGTPARYTFPDDQFFDGPYHLNSKGRSVRTSRIINDLSHYLSGKALCAATNARM